MAVKRPGAYVALAVNYADDEAIMDAGEYAELMYVRILAFCGRTPKTEGWISEKQIRTRLGLELVPEVGPETAPEKRAERLAEVGLLERDGTGYRVKSWLKWNRSAEEIERTRVQDRDRKNGSTSTNTGNVTGKRTGKQTGTVTGIQHPETETETETESGGRRIKRATQLPQDFRPSDKHVSLAAELGVDLKREWPKFCDHHGSKGSTFKDWGLALNKWIRNAEGYGGNVRPIRSEPDEQGRIALPPMPKGFFDQ